MSRLPVVFCVAILGAAPAFGEVNGPKPLTEPLLETAKRHEGKQVLVIFTARWDLSGAILKKMMEDEEVKAVLRLDGLVSYVADCTEGDSVGTTEMRKHGVNAIPFSAALLHPDGMITFARLNLTSEKTLAHSLRTLVNK